MTPEQPMTPEEPMTPERSAAPEQPMTPPEPTPEESTTSRERMTHDEASTASAPEMPTAEGPRPQDLGERAPRSLEFLLDVPLQVTAELGRRKMRIGDLLALAKGSVIELDKVAGEPLDIRVNGQLVARGEAVVVNDKFGVRLTDVVSRSERVQRIS